MQNNQIMTQNNQNMTQSNHNLMQNDEFWCKTAISDAVWTEKDAKQPNYFLNWPKSEKTGLKHTRTTKIWHKMTKCE